MTKSMLGRYSNQYSSATVIESRALPEHLREVKELTRVWTVSKYRRKGYASSLMKDICHKANLTGTVLILIPETFGKKPIDFNLCQWYARFGFGVIQANPTLMARMPQTHTISATSPEQSEVTSV